jgi:hypothetical protein
MMLNHRIGALIVLVVLAAAPAAVSGLGCPNDWEICEDGTRVDRD